MKTKYTRYKYLWWRCARLDIIRASTLACCSYISRTSSSTASFQGKWESIKNVVEWPALFVVTNPWGKRRFL